MRKVQRTIVLLLGLCLLFSLAACSSGTTGTSATPASSAAPASAAPASAAPETGSKDLKLGIDGEPRALNFADTGGTQAATFYAFACYSRLWTYTTDGEFHYLLGKSYEYSADNTQLTIKIRDDAKFSNGDPITAADVLFSFTYTDKVNNMRTTTLDLPNSKAVDDTTLVLALKQKTPTQIEDMQLLGIASQKWTEDGTNDDHININTVASGPYYLPNSWLTGEKMELVKNPYYFDKDSIKYDTITAYFVADESTRYLQFTTGDFDLCYLTDSKNIDSVKGDSKFALVQAPVQLNVAFVMDTEGHDTFKNQDIRLAICYAIDVQTIVSTICGSAFKPATSLLPSTSWAYKNEEYGYNVDKAKEYMEKSGVKDFTFNMEFMDTPINKNVAEAIQGYLSEIGITMTLQPVDAPTFFNDMLSGKIDCSISQWSGSNDPGGVLNPWLSTSRVAMQHLPTDIQVLLDKAATSNASQDERKAMFADLQDQIKEFGKFVPLFEQTINYGEANGVDVSKSIQGDGYLIPYFFA